MGLDTTHDCWHGAYSAFMRWRTRLAQVAGLPPLVLMESFYFEGEFQSDPFRMLLLLNGVHESKGSHLLEDLRAGLPIRWNALKPDVLHALLNHSDCDGELAVEICGPLADRLQELVDASPDEDMGGHIGPSWHEKTRVFIAGLRRAAEAGEAVGFH